MKTLKKPKFKKGDVVSHPFNLYNETSGRIIEVERVYKRLDKYTGKFDPQGLVTRESDISSIAIPYTFDGETLTLTYPKGSLHGEREIVETAKFYGYAYTVESPKMRSVFSESSLKIK